MNTTTIRLYVSERVATLAAEKPTNAQITLSFGKDVLPKLSAGQRQTLVVKTPKGAELSIVRGDTHAIWGSHQSDRKGFDTLWGVLSAKAGNAVDLELISASEATTSTSKSSVPVVAIDF